ncbi:MAG: hypothetical protein LBC13_02505 [Clostridiales bacterium]|jgi:hypothetical protein|nr:hypothetical protein [Clostridiales bacterium]
MCRCRVCILGVFIIAGLLLFGACAEDGGEPDSYSVSGRIIEEVMTDETADGTSSDKRGIRGAEIRINGEGLDTPAYTADDGGFSLSELSFGDILTFVSENYDIEYYAVTGNAEGVELKGVRKVAAKVTGYILKASVEGGGVVFVNGEKLSGERFFENGGDGVVKLSLRAQAAEGNMLKSWSMGNIMLPREEAERYITEDTVLSVVFERYCVLNVAYVSSGKVSAEGAYSAEDGSYRCFMGDKVKLTAVKSTDRDLFLGWYDEFGGDLFAYEIYEIKADAYEMFLEARFAKLPDPPALREENGIVYWDAVDGAAGYTVYINGENTGEITETFFDVAGSITASGIYRISAEAAGIVIYGRNYAVRSEETEIAVFLPPAAPEGGLFYEADDGKIMYILLLPRGADGLSVYIDGHPYITMVFENGEWRITEVKGNSPSFTAESETETKGAYIAVDLTFALSEPSPHEIYAVCRANGKQSAVGAESLRKANMPKFVNVTCENDILRWKFGEPETEFTIYVNGAEVSAAILADEHGFYADLSVFDIPRDAEIAITADKPGYISAIVTLHLSEHEK